MARQDMRDFALKFFRVFGAEIPDPQAEEVDVALPAGLAEHFGQERLRLVFDAETLDPDEHLVVFGSRTFEQMIDYIRRRGQRTCTALPARHPRASEPLAELEIVDGELQGARLTETTETCALFTFLLTYTSDEREQELYQVVVDSGAQVRLDLLEAYADSTPAAEPGKPRLKAMDLTKMAQAAQEAAVFRANQHAEEIEKQALQRVHRDVSRLITYYNQRIEELRVPDPAERAQREKELRAELERKTDEEIATRRLHVDLELLTTCLMELPREMHRGEVVNSSAKAPVLLVRDLYTGETFWPECLACHRPARAIEACRGGHVACEDCVAVCSACGEHVCRECGWQPCVVGQQPICAQCKETCSSCRGWVCAEHRQVCPRCDKQVCDNCIGVCALCGEAQCREHLTACAVCGAPTCPDCTVTCIVCHQAVCKEHAQGCSTCGQTVCDRDLLICVVCGKGGCPNHVGACATCGALVCEADSRHCVQCGRRFCAQHILACAACGAPICPDCARQCSVCGGALCGEHRLICEVCEKTFCPDHATRCDVCGRARCEAHPLRCETCGKNLCSEHAAHCANCGREIPRCTDHAPRCHQCGQTFCARHLGTCAVCGESICHDDALYCIRCLKPLCAAHHPVCVVCGRPNCPEHSGRCAVCDRQFCPEHGTRCAVCGGMCCDNHYQTCPECDLPICTECRAGPEQPCPLCTALEAAEQLPAEQVDVLLAQYEHRGDYSRWDWAQTAGGRVFKGERFGGAVIVTTDRDGRILAEQHHGLRG